MSILVDERTRLICQGLGSAGRFHLKKCMEYAAECDNADAIVGGVHPGKGGETFEGLPIFEAVEDAVDETGANASMIFVPPAFAADAILEAAQAGIGLICCITEGIPVGDMMRVRKYVSDRNITLVGPNCPGVITPGVMKIGIMPGYIHRPGNVGIVSRSGTLTYAAVWQVTNRDLGQSSCIGMGGDPIHGMGFVGALEQFEKDDATEAIILIGEIGGTDEQAAAAYIEENVSKPVIAFIAGETAPPGRRMGHAGAIISGGGGTAAEKIEALEAVGVHVTRNPAEIGKTVVEALD